MRNSIEIKRIKFALSLFLVLLCLSGKALGAENRKASVSSGTLYVVQDDGSVLNFGPGSYYLRFSRSRSDGVFKIPTLEGITGIDVGSNHALALDAEGCIWAWGRNKYGALGFQKEKVIKKPKRFEKLCGVADFDAGVYSSIFLFKKSNSVAFWGSSVPDELSGKIIRFEEPIKSVVSYSLSFAITENGGVYAWGEPGTMQGILNTDAKSSWKPEKLNIPCRVKQIDVALDVIFVCESGDVYIYGKNTAGTLGTGNTNSFSRITKHPTLSGVEKIMGATIRIAKLKNGKYLGWGDQLLGPIEWTNSGYVLDPIELYPPEGVVDFYSHQSSIFFIHKDGSVSRLVPEEHWLFPVKYSLEDYSFKKYQYYDIEKE